MSSLPCPVCRVKMCSKLSSYFWDNLMCCSWFFWLQCDLLQNYQTYVNEFPTALQQIRKSCSNNKRFKHFIKVCTQTTDPSIQVRVVVDYITLSNIQKFNESSVFCCDVQMCADAPVQYQKATIGISILTSAVI